MDPEQVKFLLDALNDLIQIKTLIRKVVPTYEFTAPQEREFKEILKQLYAKLDPLFTNYLNVSSEIQGKNDFKSALMEKYDKNKIILVSANSSKKILKKMGIDPRKVIVTGGPLFFEDFKVINPNIPEQALKGIRKKCKRIIDELKAIDWKVNDLLFVYEGYNKADDLIIDKMDRLEKIIKSDIELFEIPNWDELKD
jgi:hypothetical protein